MNYLEIFNEAWAKCGFHNRVDTVNGLKGEPAKLHNFINEEYTLLQNARDWNFLDVSETQGVTQAFGRYSGVNAQRWYRVMYNNQDLTYIPFAEWVGMTLTEGPPSVFTVDAMTRDLIFNPLDGDYNIETLYKRRPERLVSNGQVPFWPSDFHLLIVFAGAAAFGAYLGDNAIEDSALVSKDVMFGQCERLFVDAKVMKSSRPFIV